MGLGEYPGVIFVSIREVTEERSMLSRVMRRIVMTGIMGGLLFSCSSRARVVWERKVGDGYLSSVVENGGILYGGGWMFVQFNQEGNILKLQKGDSYISMELVKVGGRIIYVAEKCLDNPMIEIGDATRGYFIPFSNGLFEGEFGVLRNFLMATHDGKVIIGGEYFLEKPFYLKGKTVPFLMLYDVEKEKREWISVYGKNRDIKEKNDFLFNSITEISDGYIVGTSNRLLLIQKKNGQILCEKEVMELEILHKLWPGSKGGIYVSGKGKDGKSKLLKMNSSFEKEWEYVVKGQGFIMWFSETSDGGYLMAKGISQYTNKQKGSYEVTICMIKLDQTLRERWKLYFGERASRNEVITGLEVFPGEYVLVGSIWRYLRNRSYPGQWVSRGWIVKIREKGVKR